MISYDPRCWMGSYWPTPPIPDSHDALAREFAEFLTVTREYMTWQNIELGWGRPDVFAIKRTLNLDKLIPTTVEVKVSRADFLRDKREGKWRAYLPYSRYLMFAAPAGIIGPNEVPRVSGFQCGLWVRDKDGWAKLKQGTPNHNWDIGKRELMKLVIRRRDPMQAELVDQWFAYKEAQDAAAERRPD